MGMLSPFVTLYAKAKGTSYLLIGIISAMPALGAIGLSLLRSTIIRHVGSFRAIYLSMLLTAFSVFLLPFIPVYTWIIVRFFEGMGFGLLYISCDTWVNQMVDPQLRGRVIAAYVATPAISLAFGILLISAFDVTSAYPFIISAFLFLAAIMPLVYLRNNLSVEETGSAAEVFRNVLREPQLCFLMFLFCALQITSISLLPIFTLHRGYTSDVSVTLVTVLVVGSIVIQPVIGWLADKMNRYTLLLISIIGTIAGLLALIMLSNESTWIWSIVFLLGVAGGALITVVMTIVGQRFTAGQLMSFNTTLGLMKNVAYLITPALVGLIMHIWNPDGLPVTLLLLALVVLVAVIFSGGSFSRTAGLRVAVNP